MADRCALGFSSLVTVVRLHAGGPQSFRKKSLNFLQSVAWPIDTQRRGETNALE